MSEPSLDLVRILVFKGIVTAGRIEEARRADGSGDPVEALVERGLVRQDLIDGLRSTYGHLAWRYADPKHLDHALLRAGAVDARDLARARRVRDEREAQAVPWRTPPLLAPPGRVTATPGKPPATPPGPGEPGNQDDQETIDELRLPWLRGEKGKEEKS